MDVNQTLTMDSVFLPKKDREYLEAKNLQYSEVQEGNINGLIIDNYPLPQGKYNVSAVKLLIFIPQGYNDVNPDMFYCYPRLFFNPNNSAPAATEGNVTFNSVVWQQWSRHLNTGNDWRAGIDGIHSYLQKVNQALKTA